MRTPHPVRRTLAVLGIALASVVGSLAVPATSGGAQDLGGPAVEYATASDRAVAFLLTRYEAGKGTWTASQHADLVLALAALNGSRATAIESYERMEQAVATAVGAGPAPDVATTAKAAIAADALGVDPGDVGGHDLEARLRQAIVASGPGAGRVGAATVPAQALAVLALERTSAGAPARTTAWLAAQQCPDGGFSASTCDRADGFATGLAASALHAAGATVDRDQALDWLEAHQRADGGYPVAAAPGASDTAATGIATQALAAAGRDATVVDDGRFLLYGLQTRTGTDTGALPTRRGVDGDLLTATVQGVLAWTAAGLGELAFPTITGEPCPPARGVTVVVDLTHFDDTIRIACAPGTHASGTSAVQAAGFTIGWHPLYPGGGPGLGGAVCQLAGQPAAGYPTCWFTGFWSYWHARPDAQWVFSSCGIDNRTPRQGTVEGWRYEPDVDNHIAAAPLTDVRFPRVTVETPPHVAPGTATTIDVTVARTTPRVAPAPGADPEPCSLPPQTRPEAYTPTVTGPVAGGLVEVRVDGEPVGDPLRLAADGTVELSTVLPLGDHDVTAHYLGTATDLPSPSVAAPVLVAPPTTTTVTADPTTTPTGEDVALTARVTRTQGGAPVTQGQVELRADGEPLGAPVALKADGTATLTTAFDDVGAVEVTAHHLGSTAGLPSDSAPLTVTVEEGELEQLVRDLYDAVLGRPPGAGDLTYWVERFQAGTAPAKLAESLARTREGWSQVVRQHYRLALSREGDAGGVSYWTDTLQRTNAPDTLLTTLFASPEVFSARSGGTNAGYVTYLYGRVLGRAPDADGLAYWVGRLDAFPGQASVARRDAARALAFTPEGIRRQVDADHTAVCDVPAPAGAVTTLTNLFKASRLNPSTLRAAIVIRGCP